MPKPENNSIPVTSEEVTFKPTPIDLSRWAELKSDSMNGRFIKTQVIENFIREYFQRIYHQTVDVSQIDTEDIPEKCSDSEGWELLTPEIWGDLERFNKTVASRHGLQVVDGKIRMGAHGFLAWRPQEFSNRKHAMENAQEEERTKRAIKQSRSQVAERVPGSNPYFEADIRTEEGHVIDKKSL